jgi:hypothetical protein
MPAAKKGRAKRWNRYFSTQGDAHNDRMESARHASSLSRCAASTQMVVPQAPIVRYHFVRPSLGGSVRKCGAAEDDQRLLAFRQAFLLVRRFNINFSYKTCDVCLLGYHLPKDTAADDRQTNKWKSGKKVLSSFFNKSHRQMCRPSPILYRQNRTLDRYLDLHFPTCFFGSP